MRVLVAQFSPRFEVALDLAQQHLDAGDEVIFLGCEGEMSACWMNVHHTRSVCAKCRQTRELGRSLLTPRPPFRSFVNLTDANRAELRNLQADFRNL